MNHETVRFAVVGCGHIGRRHSEKIAENPRARLVAQCDLKPRTAVLSPESYADVPYFRSVEELIASALPFDVACVCVPNGLHAAVALSLLGAGRSVLIEKPIVLDVCDGEALRQMAAAHGARIYGVLQNRYSPVSQWLHDVVRSGALGRIYNIQMQCLWNRDARYYTPESWHGDARLDGGTLYTQYSHFLDLLLWTMGPVEVLGASFSNYAHEGMIGFEDSGTVRFRTASGADGQLFYSTAVFGRNLEVSMTILAERGTIKLGGPFLNVLEHAVIEGQDIPPMATSAAGNDYGGYSGSAQNHHHVIANVVADMLGEPAATTSLDESLEVVCLIQDIYRFR